MGNDFAKMELCLNKNVDVLRERNFLVDEESKVPSRYVAGLESTFEAKKHQ